MDPVDLMIELGLQKDFNQFFRQPAANENQDDVLELIRHPRSVVTFSDSGAHVSQIMDSSLHDGARTSTSAFRPLVQDPLISELLPSAAR